MQTRGHASRLGIEGVRPWIRGLLIGGLLAGTAITSAQAQTFPSSEDTPPAGWDGPVFELSQDYPAAPPPAEAYPWKSINFKRGFLQYPRAVLAYALEGNVAVDWRGQDNAVRTWYHAPWMHPGPNGREFVHGLTRERDSRPGELHPNQTATVQNWAVSLYNAPGGYAIGQVWSDPDAPDASKARFPDGTVAIKLLFTRATPQEVPFLEGAPEWEANTGTSTSSIRTVRLLQVDIAVRDDRADDTTGWVFGTFVYDKDAPGLAQNEGWDKLTPLGIMWGNDPDLLGVAGRLKETRIGARGRQLVTHLGWEGRLNGPVDNPNSSCLSCHGAGQDPMGSMIPNVNSAASLQRFFRNVPAGVAFNADLDDDHVSTDYSLQIAFGIRNQRRASIPGLEPEAPDEAQIPREGAVDEAEYPEDQAAPAPVDKEAVETEGGLGMSPGGWLAVALLAIALLALGWWRLRERARGPVGIE